MENQVTNPFKDAIKNFLNKTAKNDLVFREHCKNPDKNIEDCMTYILNSVQKSKRNGFADEEIFGLARHYFEEDNVKVGDKVQCKVIVNTEIELTDEEIQAEKEKAKLEVFNAEKSRLTNKTIKKTNLTIVTETEVKGGQIDLF